MTVRIALVHYSAPPTIGGVERILEAHARLFASAGHQVRVVCGAGGMPQADDRPSQSSPGRRGYKADQEAALQPRSHDYSTKSETNFRSPAPIDLSLLPSIATSFPEVEQAQAELSHGKTTGAFRSLRENLIAKLRPLFAEQDVVMLHNVCTMPFHPALTAALWQLAIELPHVRFICWVHDLAAVNPDYHIPEAYPWDLLRCANDRFEYVAVSELRQHQLMEMTGRGPEQCRVIPNGIDVVAELKLTRNVEQLTRTLDLLEQDLILLQPTRLLRRKNVELSLKVTAALKAAGKRVSLLVTGAPDPHNATSKAYANFLQSLRSELDLKNDCYFLGQLFEVSEDDVASLYGVADALFFPSHQEGFGLPVLEAALHRLPVFCTDVEPLRSLPGALPFPPSAHPDKIAAMMIRQMQGWPANSPRKAVVRNYAWSAIYRNCLAPLLAETKNFKHP